MSVKDPATVSRYAKQHANLVAALANIAEFVESMPAPDEQSHIQNIDYGYTGSVGKMHELILQACNIADELGK